MIHIFEKLLELLKKLHALIDPVLKITITEEPTTITAKITAPKCNELKVALLQNTREYAELLALFVTVQSASITVNENSFTVKITGDRIIKNFNVFCMFAHSAMGAFNKRVEVALSHQEAKNV